MGPSGPLAGLSQEIEAARKDQLAPAEIPALLAAHRAGEDAARQRLQDGLRFLLYEHHATREPLDAYTVGKSLHRLGSRMAALGDAVERLRKNEVADAVSYARDEIYRSRYDFHRETSPHLLPPSSTNANRRRNGQPEYQPVRQVTMPDATPGEDSPEEIPREKQTMPIELAEAAELAEAIAQDDFELEVLKMLADGYAIRTIAATLAVSKHRIETTIKRFRARADELND